ncbi:unnamed protein product [Bursaphelenchus okinawaensis]|uniref:RING-type domain-containing protein n=1 Tax=Bursaphelenchus okinawaensis TaxID=465554 RepID=A0A811LA66_9BILA|nr:unnamed protein product [Bursaphelenchus okinawaensis]CAG9120440.1 unnamed protein product [Bursaphelenchus okinawaensis]
MSKIGFIDKSDVVVRDLEAEADVEDVLYKALKHWNLVDQVVEEQAHKIEAESANDVGHTGQPCFQVGDRVFLHATMWDKIKEGFKMWDVPFKEKILKFYMCIGCVVSTEDYKSTTRFFVRTPEQELTLGTDFTVPNFILKKAPEIIKFKEFDFVVVVDQTVNNATTYSVVNQQEGGALCTLKQFQSDVIVFGDQTRNIMIPVYDAEEPWLVERDSRLYFETTKNTTDLPKNKMTDLIFGTKGEKLSSEAALSTLVHLNNERSFFMFAQACNKDPDFVNTVINGGVPLAIAIEMNSPFLINILVTCGADTRVMDRRGNTLLHVATATGSTHVVQAILPYLTEFLNTPNLAGDTPFHILCKKKNFELISKFLDIPEVDTTFRDSEGNTGLHILIKMDDFDQERLACLRLFMKQGPWLHATNGENMVPLQAAITWKKELAVDLFLDKRSGRDRPIGLHYADLSIAQVAAKVGNFNIFQRIAADCDGVFIETSTKKTVMHFAVEGWALNEDDDYQRCRIIQLLLARHDTVKLNQADLFENTPVHLLARFVNECDRRKPYTDDIFESLVSSKDQGLMALINASFGNYPLATLCFFSTCGADFWHINADGFTPLDLLGRQELQVLMAACSRAGVNSWTQMPERKSLSAPLFRSCFRCKEKMDPNNVVYCLPCQHYFACANCSQDIARMDRCMICSSEIQSMRVLRDDIDELLHGDVAPQCTQDGRQVTDVLCELKKQISLLEDSILCEICMEEQCKVVFDCGHTACRTCSSEEVLKTCHMCRQPITKRLTIY